jgi:predicted enzyme related to lactoylglutathione lyase
MTHTTNHIDYIEFGAVDVPTVKQFYTAVFGWTFIDYGPEYTEFGSAGLIGGFTTQTVPMRGGALVILYSHALEQTLQNIERHGGTIVLPIFSFPGGRRFHFTDPSGNELAVWSTE